MMRHEMIDPESKQAITIRNKEGEVLHYMEFAEPLTDEQFQKLVAWASNDLHVEKDAKMTPFLTIPRNDENGKE